MRKVLYLSKVACDALEARAKLQVGQTGLGVTPEMVARGLIYQALGLTEMGEERVVTKLAPPTPQTNEIMNPSEWVPEQK